MQNVEFHNLYWLSDTGVSQISGKMGEECGVVGNEGNLEQILIGKWEGEGNNIEIIWGNLIRMDFDYSCFRNSVERHSHELRNEP